jgi:ABC-type sulfate transport system substrate-binding protein
MNEATTARQGQRWTSMHSERQMMVAKGNPKEIAGIDDLVRSDVRTSLHNPTPGTERTRTVISHSLRPKSYRISRFGFVKARPDELILKPIN